jgi:glycosyltransferase involved in cell wall biosynthesis
MTLLSVVVPIRDMGGKLSPLFNWVDRALKLDCEVVLVHDFFDFVTENEITQFVNLHKSQKIKFFSSKFNSPGLARNTGMIHASGEFIAFWDADDYPEVDNFIALAQQCKNTVSDVGIGGFEAIDESGKLIKAYPTHIQRNLNKIAIYPGLWRMVFRSNLLSDRKFTKLLLAEDQVFLSQLRLSERKVLFFNRIVYKYTVLRKGSLTTKKENLPDLISSLELFLIQISGKQSRTSINFNITLIVRNFLTILKNGTLVQSKNAMSTFLKILRKYPISTIHIVAEIVFFKVKEFGN